MHAARDKAVIELKERPDRVTPSGLKLVRENHGRNYYPEDDYELGTILSLGEGEGWEPAEVGATVIVRAMSGGAAGADIGEAMGRRRGEIVVVDRDEIVSVWEE